MIKDFWLNLPVKDIKRSKEFFSQLGFKFDSPHGNTDTSAALRIGDKQTVVMLFEESQFKNFTNCDVADVKKSSEVLLSFDAQSKEEVDELVEKVKKAGGTSTHKPSEMTGWMYGCVFTDPDGHRWNILHMDMGKMPR